MSNHTSSNSGDLTIVLPRTNHTHGSDLDSSDDDTHLSHHAWPSRTSKHSIDSQVIAAPDNDGMEESTLKGLVAGAAIVVAILIILCIFRCRRRRPSPYVPSPSLVYDMHTRMESPESAMVRPSRFRLLGKGRGSITTTSGSDLTARSSASPIVAARRRSKGSSSHDPSLLSTACVDPVITAARLPLDEISLYEMVGRGAFGEVYRGVYHDDLVAIKRIVSDRRHDIVYIESFLSEAKLLARLQHPHIVQFVGVAWNSLLDLCIVSDFMEGGDLRSLLHRFERVEYRPKGFDLEKVRIALHVMHAIAYLHSLSPVVLHRDLKSRNILLDRQHNAKLADFGVARERIDCNMTAGVGSSLWMAPEVMVGDRYDEKADIYSFGVLLSELDTHLSPYAHAREPRDGMRRIPEAILLQMVSMGKIQVEFSETCDPISREMTVLARECVAKEPSTRPTAAHVLHRLHLIYRKVGPH